MSEYQQATSTSLSFKFLSSHAFDAPVLTRQELIANAKELTYQNLSNPHGYDPDNALCSHSFFHHHLEGDAAFAALNKILSIADSEDINPNLKSMLEQAPGKYMGYAFEFGAALQKNENHLKTTEGQEQKRMMYNTMAQMQKGIESIVAPDEKTDALSNFIRFACNEKIEEYCETLGSYAQQQGVIASRYLSAHPL